MRSATSPHQRRSTAGLAKDPENRPEQEEQPLLEGVDEEPSGKQQAWWKGGLSVSPTLLAKAYYGATSASGVFLYPYIGLYMRDLGMSDSQIGVLSALRPWLGMAATMGGPMLADRLGIHRAMLITGFVVSTLLRGTMWTSHDMIMAAVLLLISDVVAAPVGPMADSIVLLGCKSEADYGRQRVWGSIGWGAVAPLAGMLVQHFGLGMAFLGFCVLSIPTLLVVAGLHYPTGLAAGQGKQPGSDTAEMDISSSSSSSGQQAAGKVVAAGKVAQTTPQTPEDESAPLLWEKGERKLQQTLQQGGEDPDRDSVPLISSAVPDSSGEQAVQPWEAAGGSQPAHRSFRSPTSDDALLLPAARRQTVVSEPGVPASASDSASTGGEHKYRPHVSEAGLRRRITTSGVGRSSDAGGGGMEPVMSAGDSSPVSGSNASTGGSSDATVGTVVALPVQFAESLGGDLLHDAAATAAQEAMHDKAAPASAAEHALRQEHVDMQAGSAMGDVGAGGAARAAGRGTSGLDKRLLPGTPASGDSTPTKHAPHTPYQPPAPTSPHLALSPESPSADMGTAGMDQGITLTPHVGDAEPYASQAYARHRHRGRGTTTTSGGGSSATAAQEAMTSAGGYPAAEDAPAACKTEEDAMASPHGSPVDTSQSYGYADVSWGQGQQPDAGLREDRDPAHDVSPDRQQQQQYMAAATAGSPNKTLYRRTTTSSTATPGRGSVPGYTKVDVAPSPAGTQHAQQQRGDPSQPRVSIVLEDGTVVDEEEAAAATKGGGDAPFTTNLKVLATNPDVAKLLFASLAIGFGQGIIGTFLFLFAADLHASTTLMGLLLTADCVAETPVFYHQGAILSRLSPNTMLHVALFAMVVRLLLYSSVQLMPGHNPWFILPIELLQGLTLAVGWSAACVLSKRLAPPGLQASLQGLMTAVFAGLGGGLGGLVGGVLLDQKLGWSATWAGAAGLVAALWAASAAAPALMAKRVTTAQKQA